jgi:GNAT superfamily N-acetyltransferase
LTGKAGDPVPAERRQAFAELWIAPYERLAPQWAWVVRGDDGDIAGYLVAAPETPAFRRRRRIACDLPLVARYVTGGGPRTEDTDLHVRRLLGLAADPERSFSRATRRLIVGAFPAHLHVNLLPHARRRGYGARLMAALLSELAARGIAGVHCLCGDGPRPFYERQGFRTVAEAVFAGRVRLAVMGRAVDDG